MSVEAIPWALILAPVPRDIGRKPNPACKAVLIGLAKHASPDDKETFPAVRGADPLHLPVRADRADRAGPTGGGRDSGPVTRRWSPRRSSGPTGARRAEAWPCTWSATTWTRRTWRR